MSLTNFNYLIKTVYAPNEQMQQFPQDDILHKLFTTDSRWVKTVGAGQGSTTNTPAAYGMQWPIEDVRNAGWGVFSLSSPALVPPSTRAGAQAYTNLIATSHGVILDDFIFDAAKTDMQVFKNAVQRQMSTIQDDRKNQEARVMWGNGNGVLGTVSSVNTGTGVVTIAPNVAGNFTPVTKFFQPSGQNVTFLAPAGTSRSMAGIAISAVDGVNGTITIPTGGNIANIQVGDVIVNYQSWTGGNSTGNEPNGLNGIFGNTSDLYGITTSAHSSWIPATIVSNNSDPSDAFMEYMRMSIATASGTQPDVCLSHPNVVSKWGQGQLQYKRVLGTKTDYEVAGGVKTYEDTQELKGPEIIGVGPFIGDNNTPAGSQANSFLLWMGRKDSIFLGESAPAHFMEQDGDIFKFLPGSGTVAAPSYAQYVAYLVHYWQMGCYRRNTGAWSNNVNGLTL